MWSGGQTLLMVIMVAVHWLLLYLLYEPIQALWRQLLAWGWPRMGIGPSAAISMDQVSLLGWTWPVVGVQVAADAPSHAHAFIALIVLAILFLLSFLIPRRHLPWLYFFRAFLVLCLMSVTAFLWVPSLFRVEVSGYFNDLMKIGAIFLWLMPLAHAALLYIFPLGLVEKLVATWVAIGFLVVSVPLHVGALAWIVDNTSTLAMLPIYMLATFLPPILGQIGIYSYFVSRARVAERRGMPRKSLS